MTISRRRSLQAITVGAALPWESRAASTKPLPPVRLVVLDVGGTIIEDRGDVPETLRSAFAKGGITVTPAEIAEVRGASKREVVRHFVEERTQTSEAERQHLADRIYKDFNSRLIETYRTVPPIAGAEE